MKSFLLLPILALILGSCSSKQETVATLKVGVGNLISGDPNKTDGGVIVWGKSNLGDRMGMVVSSTNDKIVLTNGNWTFWAVSWNGGSDGAFEGNLMEGDTRCGSASANLVGGDQVVDLSISQAGCSNLSEPAYFPATGTTTTFQPLEISMCQPGDTLPGTCNDNFAAVRSVKVYLNGFRYNAGSLAEMHDGLTRCIDFTTDSLDQLTDLTIPAGASVGAPYVASFEAYSNINCDTSLGKITFPNGLLAGSQVADESAVLDGSTPDKTRMRLRKNVVITKPTVSSLSFSAADNVLTGSVIVTNVFASDTLVEVFSDSGCSTSVGSLDPTGASAVVPVTFSGGDGIKTAYAKRTDSLGNISACSTTSQSYTYDGTAPYVTSITSSLADNSYGVGSVINIDVTFSEQVNLFFTTPTLTLNGGAATATAVSDDNNTIVTYSFTVTSENITDLDVTAMTFGVSQLTDTAGNDPVTTLPPTPQSLAVLKDINIDTNQPTIADITTSFADATYGPSTTLDIKVKMSETVTVSGNVTVNLNNGATIVATPTLTTSTNTNDTLVFNYTPGSFGGGTIAILDVSSISLGANIVQDLALNDADMSSASGIFSTNHTIPINLTQPTITSVGITEGGGKTYYNNDNINFEVTLLNAVSPGSCTSATITLSNSDVVNFGSLAGGNYTLNFPYTVVSDETNIYVTALNFTPGNCSDSFGNDVDTGTLPGSGASNPLGGNVDFDATAPFISNIIVSNQTSGNYGALTTFDIELTFSENIYIHGSPTIDLNNGLSNVTVYTNTANTITFQFTSGSPGSGVADTLGSYLEIIAANFAAGSITEDPTLGLGNDADNTLPSANPIVDSGYLITIDTTPPQVLSITAVADDYVTGEVISVTLTFDETIDLQSSTPEFQVDINGIFKSAIKQSFAANTITVDFPVHIGETDADGVEFTTSALISGTIQDALGNPFNSLGAAMKINGDSSVTINDFSATTQEYGLDLTGASSPYIYDSAVDPISGHLYVVGDFTNFRGNAGVNYIAKIAPDGTVVTAFNTAFAAAYSGTALTQPIHGVAVDEAQKVIIVGGFSFSDGSKTYNKIARLNNIGTLDGSFFSTGCGINCGMTNGSGIIKDVAVGKMSGQEYYTIVGDFSATTLSNYPSGNITNLKKIARINADGSIDAGFKTNCATYVAAAGEILTVESEGLGYGSNKKVYVGGTTPLTINGNTSSFHLLDGNCSPIGSIVNLTTGDVEVIRSLGNGEVYIGGSFNSGVLKYNYDGAIATLDTGFSSGLGSGVPSGSVDALEIVGPRLVIGGSFTNFDSNTVNNIVTVDKTNGSFTADFYDSQPGLSGAGNKVTTIQIFGDGVNKGVFVGGDFSNYGGNALSTAVNNETKGLILEIAP